jgi:hypothetical protein
VSTASSHLLHTPCLTPFPHPPATSSNPFRIPADTEIFRLRDEERTCKQTAKAAAACMSVQDKSTFSSRMQTLFNDDAIKQQFKDILETTKKVPWGCVG